MSSENARVKVIVRARPPQDGVTSTFNVYDDQPGLVNIRAPAADNGDVTEREFLFDDALGANTSQVDVFEKTCKSQVDHVLDGFNACLFAYGQTGSGKTYTIFGEEGDGKQGIAPRAMTYLFSSMKRRQAQKKFTVFVSFLEIYLDKLRDLGVYAGADGADGRVEFKGPGSKPPSRPGTAGSRKSAGEGGEPANLEIRENPNGSVYVQDLSAIAVSNAEEVMAVIKAGLARRQTYQTLMNEYSSRSHTIVTITVVAESKGGDGESVTGKLNLVDLAGCERLKRSGAGDQASGVEDAGTRAKEAVMINKSLSTLGTVVMALAKGDATYVPYRDAKLTRLLQDSLGGNSYTMLLATVHPRPADAEESLNTLQFANRCRNVTTQPHINFLDADADSQAKIIDKLMKEIADLKQELAAQKTHYEAKLERGKHEGLSSTIETGVSGLTLESGADAAAGEGAGAGEGKAGSRGGSRGSKRAPTGERSRGASGTADAQSLALAEAQALSREMKDKFVKKNNEFRAAQEAARNNEARLKKEIDEYRNKVATVTETLNANTQRLQLQNEETVTRYDKEMDQLKDHNNKLLNDMDAALRSVPEKLRVDSDKLRTTEATIRANAEAKEKEMLALLEKQTKDAARDMDLQREQYEHWLNLKTNELKTMLAEFQTYKAEKTAQVNTLEKHCLHLFDYSNALATIMANFDKGLYPVYEKTGIKAVNFPDKAKPGPMSADTLRDLTKYKKRADDFVKNHPTNLTATFTENNPTARTTSGAGNSEKDELLRLRQETETLRNSLQAAEQQIAANTADMRAQVEQQVLADLADHPTVEYIKRIEDERTYYKEQLHEEVRRCKDLRVALDSKQRVIDKTVSAASHSVQRFGSGMSGSRGLTGTSRFPALSSRAQS
jgi:hypothetical protein